jgi:hypothetical protein
LAGIDMDAELPAATDVEEQPARILVADAKRTFCSEQFQERLVRLLHLAHREFKDYHQGLGYVASLFSLVLEPDTVVRMLLFMNTNDKFTPGYWKAAPPAYVRDARVYGRLLQEEFPEVAQRLLSAGVVPETYVSKWFVGLNVHVLPYRALFRFVELYLEHGYMFLFKFAMQLVARIQPQLLALGPFDVAQMLALLRLDPSMLPDRNTDPEFFLSELEAAAKRPLSRDTVDLWRAEEMKVVLEKLERVRAAEEQRKAEGSDSDSEISMTDTEDERDASSESD